MRQAILLLALVATTQLAAQQRPVVRPRAGMVITRSVKLAPGRYRLASRSDSFPALTIRGDGITVDLSGVTLVGTPSTADPDQAVGLAILVDGGHDVTITGARIRGYQTGIRAVGTTDLTLTHNDLSDNWKPRLFSLIGHESLIDWLSFHHNENGEWRRFGAGIALEGVHRGLIRGNTVRRGMNGLMLTRTDSLRIEANDFSFNSGVGIGMYRATDNVIVRNWVDYNVRGYSHGYYRRGQDSADLLMFEQSSRNVVAFNSMTHGGDGLFLWAGQSTMDTGEGGSNDNLFLGNDFSYAPTNAMEATFSRNDFVANRVMGSDHGLWGGYSFQSHIVGNCFAENRIGIAIEHGQENVVAENAFARDSTAVWLWAEPIQPSDWGYPKHRDTRSRDWRFERNAFRDHRVGLRVRQTTALVEAGAVYLNVDSLAVMRDTADIRFDHRIDAVGTTVEPCGAMPEIPAAWRSRIPAGVEPRIPESPASRLPRSAIIVDEWDPYDWTTPRLWPVDSVRDGTRRLQVLGASGSWRVTRQQGIRDLWRRSGTAADTIVVTPAPGRGGDWRLELVDSAGTRFNYSWFEPIRGWDVRYLPWADSTGWNAPSFLSRREPRLDKMWYRPPADLPQANWALEATSTVDLPRGSYTLRTISDDAIQVWIDGRLVIDHADPHESLVDNTPISAGRHTLKVRYRQVDGWMELRVEIVKGRVTSTGSPGPH